MQKYFFIMFLLGVVVVAAACSTAANNDHLSKNYLVGYKDSTSAQEVKKIIEKNNGIILKHYSNLRVFKVKLKKAEAEMLAKEKLIRYVEEDKKAEIK